MELLREERPDHHCYAMACQAMSLSDQMERGAKPAPQASLKAETLVYDC